MDIQCVRSRKHTLHKEPVCRLTCALLGCAQKPIEFLWKKEKKGKERSVELWFGSRNQACVRRIMELNWPDILILAKEKSPSNLWRIGRSQHSPPSGREALEPIRASSPDLPLAPGTVPQSSRTVFAYSIRNAPTFVNTGVRALRVQVQYNGLLVGEPGMAKLMIRYVFHNFERTRNLMLVMLVCFDSCCITSVSPVLLEYLYVLGGMGKPRINAAVAL